MLVSKYTITTETIVETKVIIHVSFLLFTHLHKRTQ